MKANYFTLTINFKLEKPVRLQMKKFVVIAVFSVF